MGGVLVGSLMSSIGTVLFCLLFISDAFARVRLSPKIHSCNPRRIGIFA